jgi:hypothetical protein
MAATGGGDAGDGGDDGGSGGRQRLASALPCDEQQVRRYARYFGTGRV